MGRCFRMEYPKFEEKDYIGLNGTSEKQLLHPHFEKWQKWLVEEYTPPKDKIALFIPCAAIKPYYNSPIHKIINKTLENYENKIHRIVISNAGVIPYEFSDKYPFDSYDWNPLSESKAIQDRYYDITKDRIVAYIEKHQYKAHLSYLRLNSISYNSLKNACEQLSLELYSKPIDEVIDSDKDTDLILTYNQNLQILTKMLEENL